MMTSKKVEHPKRDWRIGGQVRGDMKPNEHPTFGRQWKQPTYALSAVIDNMSLEVVESASQSPNEICDSLDEEFQKCHQNTTG